MREDSGHADASVLASSTAAPVLASTAAPAEAPVLLPRLSALRIPRRLRWPEVELGPRAGRIALVSIGLVALVMVLFSTHGPTTAVPRTSEIFAPWEAGP